MRCPACDDVMRRRRSGGAVIARCVGCHALWIEAAEVARWIRDRCPSALSAADRGLRGVTATPTGACPSCGGTMRLGLLHGLSFDECGRCRGVFLSRSVADVVGHRAEWAGRAAASGTPAPGIEAVLELLSGSFTPW